MQLITPSKRVFIGIIMSLMLTLSLITSAAAEPATDDLQHHWAEKTMRDWIESGLLKGYSNGAFGPDLPITRAELMALINRSFDLTEKTEITFTDIDSSHWAYTDIAIAVKASYITGYDDLTIRWKQAITREEAASMVARLLKLPLDDKEYPNTFKDQAQIAQWSKPSIATLVEAKIMVGKPDGNFNPKRQLTRAEAVTLLQNALEYHNASKNAEFSAGGIYGPETGTQTFAGDVIVSAADVTLRNSVIEGDLIVTNAVGEGDVYFKKVTVKGMTIIQGGGPSSIHFEDAVLAEMTIDKQSGTVRIVITGTTTVQRVVVLSPVKLEEADITGSGFINIELAKKLPSGSQVELIGDFEKVHVYSSTIKVSMSSGSIKQLLVATGAANAEVNISKTATIAELVLDAIAKVLGQGTIDKAIVNKGAENSTFERRPGKVEGEGSNENTSSLASGGGGGGGGWSGGGGGGNGGGNEPGGGDGDLTLRGLTLSSGFVLDQLGPHFNVTGAKGFSPNVHSYRVLTDRDMAEPKKVNLTINKTSDAKVFYIVHKTGGEYVEMEDMNNNNKTVELTVRPMEDLFISIMVNSGVAGKTPELYQVSIQYPRSVQNGMQISQKWGDVKFLRIGTINGERILSTDRITLWDHETNDLILTCSIFIDTCPLPPHIDVAKGKFLVKINRDDVLLAEGIYEYDLSVADVFTGEIGLEAKPYSRQELLDMAANWGSPALPYRSGVRFTLDSEKLLQEIPEAKFISVSQMEMRGSVSKLHEGLAIEEYKVNINPMGFHNVNPLYSIGLSNTSVFSGWLVHKFDSNKIVYDEFVFVGIYDKNYKLLGQHIMVVQYDEEHVAEGSELGGNWKPQSQEPE
ncbi:S-layer homology domain-containing protein [Paenibacillaceae bacterium]|nr:S-layer homology domain-containing protein [Paenibacillaceae bacterium]